MSAWSDLSCIDIDLLRSIPTAIENHLISEMSLMCLLLHGYKKMRLKIGVIPGDMIQHAPQLLVLFVQSLQLRLEQSQLKEEIESVTNTTCLKNYCARHSIQKKTGLLKATVHIDSSVAVNIRLINHTSALGLSSLSILLVVPEFRQSKFDTLCNHQGRIGYQNDALILPLFDLATAGIISKMAQKLKDVTRPELYIYI